METEKVQKVNTNIRGFFFLILVTQVLLVLGKIAPGWTLNDVSWWLILSPTLVYVGLILLIWVLLAVILLIVGTTLLIGSRKK